MRTPTLAPLLLASLACSGQSRPDAAPTSTVTIAEAPRSTPTPPASAASLTAAAPGVRSEYPFDESSAEVTFLGRKVTGKHQGRFERVRGSVQLVDGDVTRGKVSVRIDMASVTTDVDKLSAHLRSSDFFDVERFPQATFVSTRVHRQGPQLYLVEGDLTLRGVTRSILFPATIEASRTEVAVAATFALSRHEFGIDYRGMANDLISDEVVLTLAVKARR